MKRWTRVLAVLLGSVLTLQLGLAGRGVTCIMAHAESASAAAAVAGMADMAGMPGMGGQLSAPDDGSSAAAPMAPCDHGTVPAGCQTLAPCAGGFVVVASDASQATARHEPGRVASATALAPPSRETPPEPPPPRV